MDLWRVFAAVGMLSVGALAFTADPKRVWKSEKLPVGFFGVTCFLGGMILLVLLIVMLTIAQIERTKEGRAAVGPAFLFASTSSDIL